MHGRSSRSYANGFAEERRLLGVALDQMDSCARRFRQGAREDHAGKSAAAAKVEPDLCRWREIQELQRIGNVSRPEMGKRGGRDEIRFGLPLQEESNVAVG